MITMIIRKTYAGIFALLLIVGITFQAQAQTPEPGTFGIRASLDGQTTIEVPYQFNEDFSLAPFFGLNSTEDQSTSVNFGVRPRYYMSSQNAFATYATGILGFSNNSFSNNNSSITDFMLGIGYGAEYFFSDHFSISADANLNSQFGDSNTNVRTNAVVSATVYF